MTQPIQDHLKDIAREVDAARAFAHTVFQVLNSGQDVHCDDYAKVLERSLHHIWNAHDHVKHLREKLEGTAAAPKFTPQ
jgi:hypothetical protein